MNFQSSLDIYADQIRKHNKCLKALLRKRNQLGWLRFLAFVLTVTVSFKIFIASGIFGIIPAIIGFSLFIYLIFIDTDNNEAIKNRKALIHINEEEIKILNNDFFHRQDGSNFSPAVHDYANDLDLFGNASIFQWVNRCSSEQGKNRLAQNLLHPLKIPQIEERQQAIGELAPMIEWRQQLQSFSEQTIITIATEQRTKDWLAQEESNFTSSFWKIFVPIYSLVSTGTAIATILGYIPASVFLFLYGIYFVTSLSLSRSTIKPYLLLSKIVEQVTTLEKIINWVESRNFNSNSMKQLQQKISTDNGKASLQIKKLKSILDKFDLRLNLITPIFLNSFLLWDVRQMMALNEWRKNNKQSVPKLFEVISEVEVLNSLGTIHFNYPDWCLPKFSDQHFVFESKELGHPLIPQTQRVANNFEIENNQLVSLVTGSNMAGKSTFLRSIGVNIVLAQMGAPVCARSFTVSAVRLMTSMRISDNLAENTSTFYAELKKLKTIIEAVNQHEKVFVLLDEILRGTNSHDRHKGSAAFITQLIKQHAFAVIATHDLELADLKLQFPSSIENYHFDVQVKGEELFFDYKLKSGICKSLNASLLMKKIGIELPE